MEEIIRRAGGVTKLGAAVGRHHATVLGWKKVPPAHVRTVSRLINVPAHELRPDLWDVPAPQAPAETSADGIGARRIASGLAA